MAITYVCDICDRRMSQNDEQRYIFKVEIYAAAPILELTEDDLKQDHSAEIQQLVEQLSRQHPDDVHDAVYRAFHYDLCRNCQRRIIADPLAPLRTGEEA